LGGLGINSDREIDVISVARELDIVSNSCSLDSFAFRTRIVDVRGPRTLEDLHFIYFNYAKESILKLAQYGIFFRDRRDGLINDILARAGQSNKCVSIGHQKYSNGNSHSISTGKMTLTSLAFCKEAHKTLLLLWENNWIVLLKKIVGLDSLSPIEFKNAIYSI